VDGSGLEKRTLSGAWPYVLGMAWVARGRGSHFVTTSEGIHFLEALDTG